MPDGDLPPDCQRVPDLSFSLDTVGMVPGIEREIWIDVGRDWCWDVDLELTASMDGVVEHPESLEIPVGSSRAFLTLTGVSAGTVDLTARWETIGEVQEASITVVVSDGTLPGCTGEANARLAPGGVVYLADGPASGAGIALPEGAARDDIYHVDPLDVTVRCAADQTPEGYTALGPAIEIGPVHQRFLREVPITVPLALALLPADRPREHVEFSYTGPGVTEPRVVPGASLWFQGTAGDDGRVTFETSRLGTYQAIVRSDSRSSRDREFSFRGITGFSMGSGGAALVGIKNPESFDFVAPLGGATDWQYMLHYIRTYHLGGFCTEAERTMDPEGCAMGASTSRTPPASQVHEITQDFEHWHYPDGYSGQGGTFDRQSYIQIFRDLAMMYGNINSDANADPAEPNVAAPGVPDERRRLSNADRCATPIVIPPCDGTFPNCAAGTGLIDDEYNPEGQYPAITVCDGREVRMDGERDIGIWDPESTDQDFPLEVGLAIDINGNSVRDAGEPLPRNSHEPYDDCGTDRLCNADEPGFDALTNPDPNGDDYDFQFNPRGTEGNWIRDGEPCDAMGGEAFLDAGLDGVIGSRQLADGGFDNGEGNGCWDMSRGMQNMIQSNPREMFLSYDEETARDIDIFSDGGIRDLFGFAVVQNHTMGAVLNRGWPLRLFNSHAALHFAGGILDEEFVFTNIDYRSIGKYVHIRYGDVDALDGNVREGDGGHVGTVTQVLNRLLSALAWMGARWPDMNRDNVYDRICVEPSSNCPDLNQFVIDFESPTTGRSGPATIVLPPGYHQPEFAETRYPVVYFLHGYGMEPQDLIALGIPIWNLMTSRQIPYAKRLPKMIFVFPDGQCRGDECIRGTFYADAPASTPGGAQMETFLLDLAEYVDINYRTRSPAVHSVRE